MDKRKQEPVNHWQEAVNGINVAVAEERGYPEFLERLRVMFDKKGIPRNFSHIMLKLPRMQNKMATKADTTTQHVTQYS